MTTEGRKPKEIRIIQAALEILRDQGDHGLTMRKLASRTGMSLSNVQYYFSTKEVLLAALVEDYLEKCTALITNAIAADESRSREESVKRFVSTALSDDPSIIEMCAIFRELWAVATRNPDVSMQLDHYYRRYADILCSALFPEVKDKRTRDQLKLLLVPYIEGYSVVGKAAGGDVKKVIRLLNSAVEALLSKK